MYDNDSLGDNLSRDAVENLNCAGPMQRHDLFFDQAVGGDSDAQLSGALCQCCEAISEALEVSGRNAKDSHGRSLGRLRGEKIIRHWNLLRAIELVEWSSIITRFEGCKMNADESNCLHLLTCVVECARKGRLGI